MYRPFTDKLVYYDFHIVHRIYQNESIFPTRSSWDNVILIFTGPSAQKPWMCCAADKLIDLHYVGAGAGSVSMARYRYTDGERIDNITDWALEQFVEHYGEQAGVTKDGIFAYVYAVLNNPVYRETYALDLKREFPRIPFYAAYARWREWGQALLDLHVGYESVEPYPLRRVDVPDAKAGGHAPRPILKSDRAAGVIVLDSVTQLSGVPDEAWDYVLGNRTAIDWVLDQHKERKPKDPTVREKFDTYRFADHKERVVDLLGRVVRVSVETVRITEAMRAAPR
jgi:predicted helicase